jgi:hypothetical protein
MTKRSFHILILTTLFIAIIVLASNLFMTHKLETISNKKDKTDTKLEINGHKVIGLRPGEETEQIKTMKVANTPSPEWEKNLESTIRNQGGKALKEISFNKIDSFIWVHEGIALFVESVIVTIKNDKNAETTFRVLVDAQSGKILKNWDQPVFDTANPRSKFKVKIDPRYHQE